MELDGRCDFAGHFCQAEVLDDQGIDSSFGDQPKLALGGFEFTGEDQGVHRDKAFDAVLVEELHQFGQVVFTKIVGPDAGVEGGKTEVNGVGTGGDGGAGAVPVAGRAEKLGLEGGVTQARRLCSLVGFGHGEGMKRQDAKDAKAGLRKFSDGSSRLHLWGGVHGSGTMLAQAKDEWTVAEAAHLMRRAGFGGSPQEIQRIHQLGREAAVEAYLNPDEPLNAFPMPGWADPKAAFTAMREKSGKLREARMAAQRDSSKEAQDRFRKQRQEFQRESRRQGFEGQGWWFGRLMKSQAPLREKMVLFWHDHFATSIQKVKQPALLLKQNQLFREHAFGDFKALTHAMLKDPAMMLYLDTQASVKGKPNENFAREVMELFTLGEGNYTEDDIKEAARAFTGYRFDRRQGKVIHVSRQWDDGTKTVFGKSGNFDGDQVIDILFEQQAAAEYLPTKLWRYFVEDEPPAAITKRLAKTFRDGGFKIEPVLREIFHSRAFYDNTVVRNQIKSPVQFLVQMARELELDQLATGHSTVAQVQLGQVLFMPPNVAGWDWGKAWINTNTLLSRYNIAGLVTKGSASTGPEDTGGDDMMMEMAKQAKGPMARLMTRGTKAWEGPDYEKLAPRSLREDPVKLVDALIDRFFQAKLGGKQHEAFVEYAKAKKGAIFTNHEVAELCHLMLSTPHYQLA